MSKDMATNIERSLQDLLQCGFKALSAGRLRQAMDCCKEATGTAHIEQLSRLIAQSGQHPRALAFYYYAVGKEYEDLQQWQPAFTAINAGAAARRRTVEYDEAAQIEMFEFLQQHFTRDWFAAQSQGHASAALEQQGITVN